MICDRWHYMTLGVWDFGPDGGVVWDPCHENFLDYWMDCLKPDNYPAIFWQTMGEELIWASCFCVPACAGNECGGDGCGGSCGACKGELSVCIDGQCDCDPDCYGKECGPDGCGDTCGACEAGESCEEGQCVCEPRAVCVEHANTLNSYGLRSYVPLKDLETGARCLADLFEVISERIFSSSTSWQSEFPEHTSVFFGSGNEGVSDFLLDKITFMSDGGGSNCASVVIGPSLKGWDEASGALYIRLYYFFESSSWIPPWLTPAPGEVWTLLFATDVPMYIDGPSIHNCLEAYDLMATALKFKEGHWPEKPGFDRFFLRRLGAKALNPQAGNDKAKFPWGKPFGFPFGDCGAGLYDALAQGETLIQNEDWTEGSLWPPSMSFYFLPTDPSPGSSNQQSYESAALDVLNIVLSGQSYDTNILDILADVGFEDYLLEILQPLPQSFQVEDGLDYVSEGQPPWDDALRIRVVDTTAGNPGSKVNTWLYFRATKSAEPFEPGSPEWAALLYRGFSWFATCTKYSCSPLNPKA
jgi:hypothetical protein